MPDTSRPKVDLKRPKVMGGSSTKERAGVVVCREFSRNKRERDSDLKKTLSHMEEKFTSASEELQAAEEELTELRGALSNAKRTIEALRAENAVCVEIINHLCMQSAVHPGSVLSFRPFACILCR